MKKLYFLVLLFVVGSVNAQDAIVNIPDPVFKAFLLTSGETTGFALDANLNAVTIDANQDGEIQESEALQVVILEVHFVEGITAITGLEKFSNIVKLSFAGNQLPSIDISGFYNLKTFICQGCDVTTFNMAGIDLTELSLQHGNLTTLDLSDKASLEYLTIVNQPIEFLDLSNLPLLIHLGFSQTDIATIDISNNPLLVNIFAFENNLTAIDVSTCPLLLGLVVDGNQLTSLDISSNTALMSLYCDMNQLSSLDITNNPALDFMSIDSNPFEYLLLKNGKQLNTFNVGNFPDLHYLCVDEENINFYQNQLNFGSTVEINSYCSFISGGQVYKINGNSTIDTNNNGCDIEDMMQANLKFNITNDIETGTIISNQSDEYSITVQAGNHTITPILENPTFFNVSPSEVNVTFPTETSPFTQNFCITPNGLHPDLEVAILPTTPARPGFDAEYKLILKNKGNIQQSGSVSFAYDDTVLDYEIANPVFTTQTEGLLSWAFANLEPFETREINLTLNVNSPMETPAVNGDDVLTYTANITSDQTDDLPLDNTFTLPQIVVNSFDPNDKTCLEGTAITPDMIGQYVHYMIRFENTGTFAAENIVVKDMIDETMFDVSSLVALNGSHPYVTRITGNKVEFIFEGINLPFDDANNDGYVVFKIKTLPTLALGDSFSNTASIYFDFNHPIVTEPAVTTFADLATKDFEFNSYLTIYPNPTNGILNITSKQDIEMKSISIYNVLGQMVVAVPNAKGVNHVDVSSLSTGNYFIKVVSDKGTSNTKFIKQ